MIRVSAPPERCLHRRLRRLPFEHHGYPLQQPDDVLQSTYDFRFVDRVHLIPSKVENRVQTTLARTRSGVDSFIFNAHRRPFSPVAGGGAGCRPSPRAYPSGTPRTSFPSLVSSAWERLRGVGDAAAAPRFFHPANCVFHERSIADAR